ncbi:MAG TPA: EamA family transporter [Candidatus Diapherotrites archaeon]|uniref:EamA family transporter n=1 Tax=Candidatus Iainarchaeum sp. TaxID=3101447 RepID=A0A7J4IYE0_9ARCH|nr:EamA family transporter [Candidatus Diapherotrites archaeon]
MDGQKAAYAAAIISVILLGTSFAATKLGLAEMAPVTFALLRVFLASVIFLAWIYLGGNFALLKKAFTKDWPVFMLAGLTGIALAYIFENIAIVFTPTSQVSLVLVTDTLLIALLAFLFLKEKITAKNLAGIFIGIAGVLLIIFHGYDPLSVLIPAGFAGSILALFSSLAWAIYTILLKKKAEEYGPLIATAASTMLGIPFLLIASLLLEGSPLSLPSSINGALLLIYLSIFDSVLAFYLWTYALSCLKASNVGAIVLLMPIVASVLGVAFFGEQITPPLAFGAALIFAGIYFAEKE